MNNPRQLAYFKASHLNFQGPLAIRPSFIKLLLLALMLASPAIRAAEVRELQCEYQRSPLGVDLLHPRLSWIMEAKGTDALTELGNPATSLDAVKFLCMEGSGTYRFESELPNPSNLLTDQNT